MTVIKKSAIVAHTAEEIFKLIDDIEAYPDFLPWCGKATEIFRDDSNVEASVLIASLTAAPSVTLRMGLTTKACPSNPTTPM